jgi:hypothetical protein
VAATRLAYALAGLLRLALITTSIVCSVAVVAAQEPVAVQSADSPCLRARPYPECRVFFVTSSGAYVRVAGGLGEGPMRGILDWGAMVNLSPKNAVGASWFVTGDEDGFSTGPVLRWRRWLGPTQSLDFGVGTVIAGVESARRGSVLGLVKYNPVHWFGIAARPELVRYNDVVYDPAGYRVVSGTKARLYMGAEIGGKPGLVLGGVAAVVLALGIAAFAAAWD